MMHWMIGLVAAALAGADDRATPSDLARAAAEVSAGPHVAFEIRHIRITDPDWRGMLLPNLEPLARSAGTAAWTLDDAGLRRLLELCQADATCSVTHAPRMVAQVGAKARMTSEEEVPYVASLKRRADGPPNQSSRLAFEPQVDKLHLGVRLDVLSSRLEGQALTAKLAVEEHRLVAFHTAKYVESVKPKPDAEAVAANRPKVDEGLARASFLERLTPKATPHEATISATIQVPEVDTRRIEGEWRIPAKGALLLSLGPRAGHERGFRRNYEEQLIAITAHPAEPPAPAARPQPRQAVATPAPSR